MLISSVAGCSHNTDVSVQIIQLQGVFRSVRVERLGSHWTDFLNEILNLSIFRKSVEKIPVSLNSDKNDERFTCRFTIFFCIFSSNLLRMRNISDKFVGTITKHVFKFYFIQH